jgi:hypothetical protein
MNIQVSVTSEKLGEDPPIQTYLVVLTTELGSCRERYTHVELNAFIRGVQAGAGLTTGEQVNFPEIPKE